MAGSYSSSELVLSGDELVVDQALGYPKAYARFCCSSSRDTAAAVSCYSSGPPSTFIPYALQPQQATTAAEFDEIFPIDVAVHPEGEEDEEKPSVTTNPKKLFVTLLWKQLNHLGNAGFDPALFRVDPYGNVLYYHADDASPLAWDIDHWFPASRGGLSVPSNLRILQWQVCKRKHNKLDFMVPWWDLQLGISVNQFMSIFASSNSDFRHRAFSFLFLDGENEELNASETVDSHHFPHHYVASQKKLGLAPAAIVLSRKDHRHKAASSVLKSLDINRQTRSDASPMIVRKSTTAVFKENAAPHIFTTNPYQAIVSGRDSLTQREEAMKRQLEIQKLDDQVDELKQKNDEDRMCIQELELKLMESRRRAEKHRRLAEAQSSYRTMLEKMVRDAMHQSVVYKEQVRLNQAATNALNARLEAQKAICDESETELFTRYKQRDAIEKRIKAKDLVQVRVRSRMNSVPELSTDDNIVLSLPAPTLKSSSCSTRRDSLVEEIADTNDFKCGEDATSKSPASRVRINPLFEDICNQALFSYAEKKRMASTMRKELRVFLEEEQRASMTAGSPGTLDVEEQINASENNFAQTGSSVAVETRRGREDKNLVCKQSEKQEDDESRRQRGRGNVDRWVQMLLENSQLELEPEDVDQNGESRNDGIIKPPLSPQQSVKSPEHQGNRKENITEKNKKEGTWVGHREASSVEETKAAGELKITRGKVIKQRASFEWRGNSHRRVKEKSLPRSESARSFRFPSSPSIIMGMRKGVDCMRKKAIVMSDEDSDDDHNKAESSIK